MIYYLLLINALALLLMCLAKNFARRHMWRIPETTLLGCAAIGGSTGMLLGMALFRHKTRHAKFVILGPLFLAVHLFLIWRYQLL